MKPCEDRGRDWIEAAVSPGEYMGAEKGGAPEAEGDKNDLRT